MKAFDHDDRMAILAGGQAAARDVVARLGADMPVTGPVTDAQLRAAALPVSVSAVIYSITNTFTTTGTTAAVDMSAAPAKFFSIQGIGQGGVPSAWTVTLEIGLETGSWSTLLTHNLALGNLIVLPNTLPTVALFMRLNCSLLTLGIGPTGIKVIAKAVP